MATVLEPKATNEAKSENTMSIRVYNTLTKTKEELKPVTPGKVGIYLCGPTVYKEAHIGHMVGPVIFDTISRYLSYNDYEVNWVVNITDVDDKLIAQSRERGIPMSQVATEMTMDYCANLLALGVDQITHMPRATEHMDEIIQFISDLIEKDFAYEAEGDVFFDVPKDREYGKLSNRRSDEQQGEGGGAAAKKRSPSDFALWKSAKPGEPSWESPWGNGRPGWHIECSAMSRRILGKTFDIHGGGLDLVFPHHENEVAQSECCHGETMAKVWMHNGLLRAGEAGKLGGRSDRENQADENAEESASGKMSRSKGAGGLRGLISRQGGERIRFFLLKSHYRSTIVFGEEAIEDAGTGLDKFYTFFERYERVIGRSYYLNPDADNEDRSLIAKRTDGELDEGKHDLFAEVKTLRNGFLTKMDDDFNSGAAMSDLFQLLSVLNKFVDQSKLEDQKARSDNNLSAFSRGVETLRELSAILGLFKKPAAGSASGGGDEELTDNLMQLIIELRAAARQNKDFATADKIRDALTSSKVTLEDRADGTTWKAD